MRSDTPPSERLSADDRDRRLALIHRDLVVPALPQHPMQASDDFNAATRALIAAAQMLRAAGAMSSVDPALADSLGAQAQKVTHDALEPVTKHLVDTGIATTIEEHAAVIASGLQVDDLPDEDIEAMRACGSSDPQAELELSLERLKRAAGEIAMAREIPWDEAVLVATEALSSGNGPPAAPKPRRRWLKGLGAIVKGSVLLAVDGGLLIAGIPVGVANPPAAVAVLGSLGMGFNDVAAGFGDLRAE
jgi:hypothetical protein